MEKNGSETARGYHNIRETSGKGNKRNVKRIGGGDDTWNIWESWHIVRCKDMQDGKQVKRKINVDNWASSAQDYIRKQQ